jgi:hypothetical protein
MMNRRHVRLEHFVKAVHLCERAGFRLRNLEVNAFVLYGLPGERIDTVVKTVLFVSEILGSIVPMLFTPVPTTALYTRDREYLLKIMGGTDRDLHKINGKLYPYLQMNEGSVKDYVDLQRLMFMLNAHYRSRSFQIFGNTCVSQAFLYNLRNGFEGFVKSARDGIRPVPRRADLQSALEQADRMTLIPVGSVRATSRAFIPQEEAAELMPYSPSIKERPKGSYCLMSLLKPFESVTAQP